MLKSKTDVRQQTGFRLTVEGQNAKGITQYTNTEIGGIEKIKHDNQLPIAT